MFSDVLDFDRMYTWSFPAMQCLYMYPAAGTRWAARRKLPIDRVLSGRLRLESGLTPIIISIGDQQTCTASGTKNVFPFPFSLFPPPSHEAKFARLKVRMMRNLVS